jgi:hypothetical protein
MKVSRRNFLQSTTASLGFALMDRKSLAALPHDDLENIFAEIRANLLAMINEERAVEKAPKLAMDELATQVAQKHAVDMANGGFASHWGRDGLKPYQRYSFADGIHATPSSSTRRGLHSKGRTTHTGLICRRSIRRKSLATRRTVGLGRSRVGGRRCCLSHLLF